MVLEGLPMLMEIFIKDKLNLGEQMGMGFIRASKNNSATEAILKIIRNMERGLKKPHSPISKALFNMTKNRKDY